MPHMVIFRTADGKPSYHQAEVLKEAIRFVEHLRNAEQVDDVRIFTMTEVPIEFKVQWRVELAASAVESIEPARTQAPPIVAALHPEDSAAAEAAIADAVEAELAEHAPDGEELSLFGEVQDQVAVSGGTANAPLSTATASPAASSSRFGLFNRG